VSQRSGGSAQYSKFDRERYQVVSRRFEATKTGSEWMRDEMRLLAVFEQKVDFYLFWYAEASAMRLIRPSASRPCVIWGIIEEGNKKELWMDWSVPMVLMY
jgi:hypothetical protein